MKHTIIFLIMITFLGSASEVIGQQDALFTQYIDAQLYSNPAYAGSNDHVTIAGIHRQQWAGFQGAPMTTGLMVHSPLHYESVGIGLDLWNDNIGTLNRSTAAANFAYRLKFKNGGKLSLGVKGLADFNVGNISNLSNADNDPRAFELTRSITPNAGVGILYKSPKWFLGVGVPRLLENRDTTLNGGYVNDRTAYLLAGIAFDLNNGWYFRPSAQLRAAQNSPLSVDITAMLISKDIVYFGLNYRHGASIGFIAQYKINPQIKLGYAFDLGMVSLLRSTNFGTHEVVLSYDMNYSKASVASPRFF